MPEVIPCVIDKYIGFDIDCNETVACVVEKGTKERFTTLRTDIDRMKEFFGHLTGVYSVVISVHIKEYFERG